MIDSLIKTTFCLTCPSLLWLNVFQSSQPDPLELQRQQESRRRALARKRAREQFKPRSPEPVEGRKHIEVQTELYLEEITGQLLLLIIIAVQINYYPYLCWFLDRVEEADVQTQTDAFLDRPSTPLFVPAKTGQDAATQIEEGDVSSSTLYLKQSMITYCLILSLFSCLTLT